LEMERKTTIINVAKLAGLFLALLILLRFAQLTFRDLSRRIAGDYVPYMSIVEEELPALAPQQQLPEPGRTAAPASAASEPMGELASVTQPPQLVEPPPPPADSMMAILRRQLMAIAARDPESVAEMLQSWLAEAS